MVQNAYRFHDPDVGAYRVELGRDGASGTDDEIASVKAFNQAYTKAQKTADVNAMASLWAPDAIMMPAGEPAVVGSRQIHAWLTRNQPDANVMISNDVSNWKDITVTGDYAFQWAQTFVNVRSRTADAGVHMSGTALQVLKKQPDGSWKLCSRRPGATNHGRKTRRATRVYRSTTRRPEEIRLLACNRIQHERLSDVLTGRIV